MRGIDNLISAVILVAVAVIIATFVSGWLGTFSQERANVIKNTTTQQITCQFSDMFIRNVTFNCNNNCASGTAHTLVITLVNSGKKTISLSSVVLQNSTGVLTTLNFNETKTINVGGQITAINTTSDSCHGINKTIDYVKIASQNCPLNAADSLPGSYITWINC